MLFHCPIFVIVLGMTEGGFLLPEFSPALTVDMQRHSRSVVLRRIIRHLLHSTTKAHSVAQQITAAAEIHAQSRIFFCASCTVSESCLFASFRIAVRESFVFSVSALQLEEYLSFRLPACLSNSAALACIAVSASWASCFVRSFFRSASNCFAIKFET